MLMETHNDKPGGIHILSSISQPKHIPNLKTKNNFYFLLLVNINEIQEQAFIVGKTVKVVKPVSTFKTKRSTEFQCIIAYKEDWQYHAKQSSKIYKDLDIIIQSLEQKVMWIMWIIIELLLSTPRLLPRSEEIATPFTCMSLAESWTSCTSKLEQINFLPVIAPYVRQKQIFRA